MAILGGYRGKTHDKRRVSIDFWAILAFCAAVMRFISPILIAGCAAVALSGAAQAQSTASPTELAQWLTYREPLTPPPATYAQAGQPAESSLLRPTLDTPGQRFIKFFTEGEWYFSFGVNKEYYAPTDIHVSQGNLGRDFTVHDVHAHDEPDMSGLLSGDLFGPQYNIRIGRFINKNWAVELSFDHTKYTVTDGQVANITGTGVANGPTTLNAATFQYFLHNGANNLMINGVYRKALYGEINETNSLAFLGKFGAGIMVPHVDNTIFGQGNQAIVGQKTLSNAIGIHNGWWQYGGWTTGVEGGFRYVVWAPFYIELTDKVAYSRMQNLPVFEGTAKQSLLMNEIVFSVGFTYDGTKRKN